MKTNLLRNKLFLAALIVISNSTVAGTVIVGPKKLDWVSVIGNSRWGHLAGNLEIKIADGLGNPPGVTCDQNYVTTKNTSPNFNQIVSFLLAAQLAGKPVYLGITDDPTDLAFSGRCSIISVQI